VNVFKTGFADLTGLDLSVAESILGLPQLRMLLQDFCVWSLRLEFL